MTDKLRSSLLALHKILLDDTTKKYEAIHGKIANTGTLFNLVVNDAYFQWLRPLSETIVAVDEALETEPPATHAAIVGLVRGRLFPETATDFSRGLEKAAKGSATVKSAVEATQSLL